VPREPRIYIEKVLYLITAKGLEDRDLFMDHQDYSEYMKSLCDYKKEFGFKLFAYALLPKRLCLLIELENNVTISTIMHNLNSKYTKMDLIRYPFQKFIISFFIQFCKILIYDFDNVSRRKFT